MSSTESDDTATNNETAGKKLGTRGSNNTYKQSIISSSRKGKSNRIYGKIRAGALSASPKFQVVTAAVKNDDWGYWLGLLRGEKPRTGMAVEICDPDHIWSSATIVKMTVNKQKQKTFVTVRYDGWGSEWDVDDVPWHDNSNTRLAKIFTFTKRFKCMIDLKTLVPSSKLTCTLWPSIVNFRMPDPTGTLAEKTDAENFLRTELNIFVQPYGGDIGLLPDDLRLKEGTVNGVGGMWIHTKHVKRWRHDPKKINKQTLKNFERAYQIATKDHSVPDVLPQGAFEKGSLLNTEYRIQLPSHCGSEVTIMESDELSDPDTDTEKLDDKNATSVSWRAIKPEFEPKFPAGVKIVGSIYPGGNVKKLDKLGTICATVTMGGNDFVIGTYPTQHQAQAAIQSALKVSEEDVGANKQQLVGINEEINGKILEMEAVSLETIVASFHKVTSKSKSNFSIHEWALQQLKYKDYLRKVAAAQGRTCGKRSFVEANLGRVLEIERPCRGRKRSSPRRVQNNKYETM